MGNLFAGSSFVPNEQRQRRVTLTEDSTVWGDKVTWVVDTAGDDVTLPEYDSGDTNNYHDSLRPLIVVKCAVDASGTNCVVYNTDGSTALMTFAADYSSTPAYAVFRLVSGNRNTNAWELA